MGTASLTSTTPLLAKSRNLEWALQMSDQNLLYAQVVPLALYILGRKVYRSFQGYAPALKSLFRHFQAVHWHLSAAPSLSASRFYYQISTTHTECSTSSLHHSQKPSIPH